MTGTSDPSDTGRSTSGWRAAGTTAGGGTCLEANNPFTPAPAQGLNRAEWLRRALSDRDLGVIT
ncbi:MAG: hypothetical protein JO252_15615 [Planctomycetaceae bacterium]|nr:hypothetical protein [Planctomycetaceae bacterium]